jgi:hypothetical protein
MNVYDVRGVKVAYEKFSKGQSVPFNVKNLSPGVYQVMVTANGKTFSQKLMVVK